VFCRSCGKTIEEGARFCRFCGKSQAEPVAGSASAGSSAAPARHHSGFSLERSLRQLFPRHHLQDEFTHIGTIAAFLMLLIGFVLGFFYNYSWLGTNFLLGSIGLLLFLILRESTLSHIRVRDGGPAASSASSASSSGGTRYHAGRRPAPTPSPRRRPARPSRQLPPDKKSRRLLEKTIAPDYGSVYFLSAQLGGQVSSHLFTNLGLSRRE
jgi:hypothetical protein